jgi:hypothetical protein
MVQERFTSAESVNEAGKHQGGNMTAAELLTELSATEAAFTWHVTRQGSIRGCLKNDSTKRLFDPVTAVVYLRTGTFLPLGQWTLAADAVGLDYSDCAEVVAACNYEWDPGCRQGALRHDVMTVVFQKHHATDASHKWSVTDLFIHPIRKRTATPIQ